MMLEEPVIPNTLGGCKCAEHLESVFKAYQVMGFRRHSCYRSKPLYEHGGQATLHKIRRTKPLVNHRVEAAIEQSVV